uniref:Secreted protein n=1 Tax=Schistosoma mansoni TaxID=6183 RepID=A0A5K4FBJ2_SCHMA
MNTTIIGILCICTCSIITNANAVPTNPSTVVAESPNTSTVEAESLTFKEKIVELYKNWMNEKEFNPPKESEFYERFWELFKHCFLNSKQLTKILPF